MKKIYLRIGMISFGLLLMTGILSDLSAQEIRYVDIAPGIGTLNEAIMGDTTETGARVDTFNTVYRLQRLENSAYLISSLISNIGWPLTVVAEDGDGPRPYLALKVDDTGGTPDYCFRPKGDLTLKGLHLTVLDDLDATGNRIIRASADGITLTLDDCWMDDAHQAAFRLDNDDMSLYLTNCVISNIGHPNDASNGRAIDDRGNPIDTLVFENCTFYNVTQRILRDGGGWIKYARMNNNTFVNVGSRGFSFGEIAGLDFTNNLLVNVGFLPQDTSSQEAMIEIDEIGAELEGLGFTQEINITNNNFYLDTTLFAQYLNDTTMATLVADSLAQVFIDAASNPRFFYVPVALTDPPVDLQNFIDHQMDPALDPANADDWSNPAPPNGFYHMVVPYDFGFVNSRLAGGAQDGDQLGDKNWTAEREAMTVVDFEDPLDLPFFYQFANAGDAPENLNIIANPDPSGINTSDMVLEFVVQDGADPWAGAWTDAFGNMEFTQEKHHMEMMVWKEVVSNSALKVERGGAVTEVKVPNTLTGEWELLEFDFTANIGETLTRLVFFPDFPDARTAGGTVYLDNIRIITGTVGVETLEGHTLKVYPNPAIDQMIVEYPGMTSILIRDILGKTVNAIELQGNDTYTMSVKNLADGVYFITVATDGSTYSSKFLKR